MSHITQHWIKKPREWKEWQAAGLKKEELKRRYEFQALLRLYVPRLSGKAIADPMENRARLNVLRYSTNTSCCLVLLVKPTFLRDRCHHSALMNVLVNRSHDEKLRYVCIDL